MSAVGVLLKFHKSLFSCAQRAQANPVSGRACPPGMDATPGSAAGAEAQRGALGPVFGSPRLLLRESACQGRARRRPTRSQRTRRERRRRRLRRSRSLAKRRNKSQRQLLRIRRTKRSRKRRRRGKIRKSRSNKTRSRIRNSKTRSSKARSHRTRRRRVKRRKGRRKQPQERKTPSRRPRSLPRRQPQQTPSRPSPLGTPNKGRFRMPRPSPFSLWMSGRRRSARNLRGARRVRSGRTSSCWIPAASRQQKALCQLQPSPRRPCRLP